MKRISMKANSQLVINYKKILGERVFVIVSKLLLVGGEIHLWENRLPLIYYSAANLTCMIVVVGKVCCLTTTIWWLLVVHWLLWQTLEKHWSIFCISKLVQMWKFLSISRFNLLLVYFLIFNGVEFKLVPLYFQMK